jgi:hypothetical protein
VARVIEVAVDTAPVEKEDPSELADFACEPEPALK